MTSIAGTYDYRLVGISLLISFLTAYATLDLAARVRANRVGFRSAWLFGGGFAMGCGIWCMHYTAMLAYRLPIPVYYQIPTVLLSLIAAIVASTIALEIVCQDTLNLRHVVGGSLLMGAGISAMHYIGMAAMRLRAMHHYDNGTWLLSIVLAVFISFIGLSLLFYSRDEDRGWKLRTATTLIVGLAIPAMHCAGMAAVSFVPMTEPPDISYSVTISTLATFAIPLFTCFVLGFALLTAMVDRRISGQHLLLESERRMLRALIDNIPDQMFVKDLKGQFVIANAQMARCVGAASPDELIGKTDFAFFPIELANMYHEREQEVITSGQPMFNSKAMCVDAHGTAFPILSTKVPLYDGSGTLIGVAGVRRDISEREKSEEALRETEKRYRGMFDDALISVFQLTSDGHLLHANGAMADSLAFASREEMLISPHPFWDLITSPQRRSDLLDLLARVGYVKSFEIEVFRKDLSKIWITATIRRIVENDAVLRFEGTFEDITERRMLREQLLQAQKLESVGQLAAGIAHEINTPTQYIGDNVRFLRDTFQELVAVLVTYGKLFGAVSSNSTTPDDFQKVMAAIQKADVEYLIQEIPKAIDQTLEGVTRVSGLVSAMKEFSHPGTKDKVPLDLNRAIESTLAVSRNEWKYVADLETDFDPQMPLVPCHPGEFNQVILNLIVNASHAIDDAIRKSGAPKGTITVQTRHHPTYVEIKIRDSGLGIPEQIRTRIFDPFFTTKEIGRGTGQGLAISRSVIVDKHMGSIDFTTETDVGTTFIVRLPHEKQVVTPQVELV
jgi:PAS domain S-box-containing protein